MALHDMLRLRIFVIALVAWLCISQFANGQQQKLSPEEEKNIFREFQLYNKSTFNTIKTKIYTNQAPGEGSSSTSTASRSLNVFMKSLMSEDHRLILTDDTMKMFYYIDKYDGGKEVVLKDGSGKNVFTIRRKGFGLGRVGWEGYRGSESSGSSSEKASFRVKEPFSHGLLGTKSTTCKVKYDDKRYIINPCRIEKSANAELGFKIIEKKGNTIAELKQKYSASGKPLGRNVFSFVVEPEEDEAFAVGVLVVYFMINGQI